MAVLLEQRLVEIQGVPKLCQFTRSGAFAEHLFHRVAGDDVNHQENKREDEPESGESQEEALREVPGDLEELLQERTPVDSLSLSEEVFTSCGDGFPADGGFPDGVEDGGNFGGTCGSTAGASAIFVSVVAAR